MVVPLECATPWQRKVLSSAKTKELETFLLPMKVAEFTYKMWATWRAATWKELLHLPHSTQSKASKHSECWFFQVCGVRSPSRLSLKTFMHNRQAINWIWNTWLGRGIFSFALTSWLWERELRQLNPYLLLPCKTIQIFYWHDCSNFLLTQLCNIYIIEI